MLGAFLAFAGTSHLLWARQSFLAQVPGWVPIDAGPGETFEFFVEAASNPQVMKDD